MPLCEDCFYGKWDTNSPLTEEEFLQRLSTVGIVPSGEGVVRVAIGSPFRVPMPLVADLCCLDSKICDRQVVSLHATKTGDEADVIINLARSAVYQEVGLPALKDQEA